MKISADYIRAHITTSQQLVEEVSKTKIRKGLFVGLFGTDANVVLLSDVSESRRDSNNSTYSCLGGEPAKWNISIRGILQIVDTCVIIFACGLSPPSSHFCA